jgi:hypothetical protein
MSIASGCFGSCQRQGLGGVAMGLPEFSCIPKTNLREPACRPIKVGFQKTFTAGARRLGVVSIKLIAKGRVDHHNIFFLVHLQCSAYPSIGATHYAVLSKGPPHAIKRPLCHPTQSADPLFMFAFQPVDGLCYTPLRYALDFLVPFS